MLISMSAIKDYTTTRDFRELQPILPDAQAPIYYTTTRDFRELQLKLASANVKKNYTTTRDFRELQTKIRTGGRTQDNII